MNKLMYHYIAKTVIIIISVLFMIISVLLSCFIYHLVEKIIKFFRRKKNEADRF